MITIKKFNDKPFIKNSRILFFAAVLFFVVTMPFRRFFGVAGLTEVRPAGAFPPVFGLLFGLPGALGCGIGNLAADIVSGYPLLVCVYGFIAQLLYGLLPGLMWNGFSVHEKRNRAGVTLRNVRDVQRYIVIVFTDSFLMAVLLGTILQITGLGRLLSQSTLLLFFNNLTFCILLGIPIIILKNVIQGQGPRKEMTLNVRFVLIFLILSLISAGLMGISSYGELKHYVRDPLQLWNSVYTMVSVDFFLLCGLSICFLKYLEKNITVPIEKLAKIALAYARREEAKYGEWIGACKSLAGISGETGYLASAFGKMMLDVEHYIGDITKITAEKERIRTEIQVASRLQADMLPKAEGLFAERDEFGIGTLMTPAKGVGGDFYDFFFLDENNLVLVMADVSGKGVPAALFMVVARTLIRSHLVSGLPLEQAVGEINNSLCRNNKNDMFVTAWIGILTISSGRLEFVNAGHCRPLLRHEDGTWEYEESMSGFVLAGMEDSFYCRKEIQLKQGDMLLLYTDGVTEAADIKEHLYGEKRLKKAVERMKNFTPETLLKGLWDKLKRFQGQAEQFDDITMLALAYNGIEFMKKTSEAKIEYMEEFADFLDKALDEKGISSQTAVKLRIALDEIFSNICYYSGAEQVTEGIRVNVSGSGEKEVILFFEDDGIPYNPLEKPDADVEAPLEERREGGLGIYLVKKRMDHVSYEYRDGKNRLTVIKRDVPMRAANGGRGDTIT